MNHSYGCYWTDDCECRHIWCLEQHCGQYVTSANIDNGFNRMNFLTASVGDWDKIFAVNARGVFLCYKYAAQHMIAQGRGGRIIGACSVAGKRGDVSESQYKLRAISFGTGEPMIGPYCSTKFAVRGLTQSVGAWTISPAEGYCSFPDTKVTFRIQQVNWASMGSP